MVGAKGAPTLCAGLQHAPHPSEDETDADEKESYSSERIDALC